MVSKALLILISTLCIFLNSKAQNTRFSIEAGYGFIYNKAVKRYPDSDYQTGLQQNLIFMDKRPLGSTMDFAFRYNISKKDKISISTFYSRQRHQKLIEKDISFINQTSLTISQSINEYNNFFGLGVSKEYSLGDGNLYINPEFRVFVNTYLTEFVEVNTQGSNLTIEIGASGTKFNPQYDLELGMGIGLSLQKRLSNSALFGIKAFFNYSPSMGIGIGFQFMPFIGIAF